MWRYEGCRTLESYLGEGGWPLNLEPCVSSVDRRRMQTQTLERGGGQQRGGGVAAALSGRTRGAALALQRGGGGAAVSARGEPSPEDLAVETRKVPPPSY